MIPTSAPLPLMRWVSVGGVNTAWSATPSGTTVWVGLVPAATFTAISPSARITPLNEAGGVPTPAELCAFGYVTAPKVCAPIDVCTVTVHADDEPPGTQTPLMIDVF